MVTGDFFTRFSPFFMEGVAELYAKRGIILKPVDVSDLLLYAAYQGVAGAASDWGMKPGGRRLRQGLHADLPAGRKGVSCSSG